MEMDYELQITESILKGISEGQRELIDQGIFLVQMMSEEHENTFSDYSFVVFPFAKAYEGFLKQVFFDIGFLSQTEYTSDHLRLGKVLSPNLVRRLGDKSIYEKICSRGWCQLADEIWDTWKAARNQVFHYFAHNLHSLTLKEAVVLCNMILINMDKILSVYMGDTAISDSESVRVIDFVKKP